MGQEKINYLRVRAGAIPLRFLWVNPSGSGFATGAADGGYPTSFF
jgi:hypothetical protein